LFSIICGLVVPYFLQSVADYLQLILAAQREATTEYPRDGPLAHHVDVKRMEHDLCNGGALKLTFCDSTLTFGESLNRLLYLS